MIIKLLFFFYLSSSYLGATHIHQDGLESLSDCKVHLLVKNLNSADAHDGLFTLFGCGACFESIAFYTHCFVQSLSKGFDAQAPPFFF